MKSRFLDGHFFFSERRSRIQEKLDEMKKVIISKCFLFILFPIVSRSGRSLASQRSMYARIQRRRPGESASRFACRLYYGRERSINRIEVRRAKSSRTSKPIATRRTLTILYTSGRFR